MYALSRNMKKISEFFIETFDVLVVKFSVCLNRHVFVMKLEIRVRKITYH